MKGLFTSRVTVIDDNMNEADTILRGLAKLGIGATYFTGLIPDEFPERPLEGIRLAFLDLHIVSTSGGSRSALLSTIGILKQIISATKMLTGIICWTNHPEEFEEFGVLLEERFSEFKPLFLLPLPKCGFNITDVDPLRSLLDNILESDKIIYLDEQSDSSDPCKGDESEKKEVNPALSINSIKDIISDTQATISEAIDSLDTAKLNMSISDILSDCIDFKLSCEWEQFVHDAASNTTSLLAQIAAEDDCSLLSIQAAIGRAYSDIRCKDELSAYRCFVKGCIPILLDYLFNYSSDGFNDADKHITNLLEEMQNPSSHSQQIRAKLNRVLLTADELPPIGDVHPGNVYIQSGFQSDSGKFPFDFDLKSIRGAIYKLWGSSASRENLKDADWKKAVREIAESSIPCVMEITPVCDYSNNKSNQARLIGGLLLKISDDLPINMTPSGRISIPADSRIHSKLIEPVYVTDSIQDVNGSYALILHARCIFSMPYDAFKECSPLLRYRHDVLVDVISWFASHAARPGYTSV